MNIAMQNRATKLLFMLLLIVTELCGQDSEIDNRVNNGELKMTFPSIYFKTNSTNYAAMPYTVDSCFKYIALYFENNINSLTIWKDSIETEELTNNRIKKLKTGLGKYIWTGKIDIRSMGKEQKISRRTINMTADSTKIKYLLSLNSVFDASKTHILNGKIKYSHYMRPKIWCWKCWINGFHLNKRGREMRRMERAKIKLLKAAP